MYYQLEDGRVISMSIEEYLAMEDEDFRTIKSFNTGFYLNDPHFGSAIKNPKKDIIELEYIPNREIPEDILNNKLVKDFFDENE